MLDNMDIVPVIIIPEGIVIPNRSKAVDFTVVVWQHTPKVKQYTSISSRLC